MEERRVAIERAILAEARNGATHTELWLVARTASRFLTTDRFEEIVDALVAAGQLHESEGHWTSTPAGRERLDRSTA